MAITNPKSVDQYINMVCEIRAALENISEFIGTLPAPDDDHNIPGMNYAQLGDIARLHELVGEACQVTCEVGGLRTETGVSHASDQELGKGDRTA
jgi:hypothetical protein